MDIGSQYVPPKYYLLRIKFAPDRSTYFDIVGSAISEVECRKKAAELHNLFPKREYVIVQTVDFFKD